MSAAARAGSPQQRRAVGQFAQWWWLWLIGGAIWILAGIFILQLDRRSITVAGLAIGIMLLVAGAEEFVMAYVVDGLKWLWYIFGVILLISGIWVLFNPNKAVLAVAAVARLHLRPDRHLLDHRGVHDQGCQPALGPRPDLRDHHGRPGLLGSAGKSSPSRSIPC